jgi:hypothetical protein
MLIPILTIGFVGFGASLAYSVDTKEIVYAVVAGTYQKHGSVYQF